MVLVHDINVISDLHINIACEAATIQEDQSAWAWELINARGCSLWGLVQSMICCRLSASSVLNCACFVSSWCPLIQVIIIMGQCSSFISWSINPPNKSILFGCTRTAWWCAFSDCDWCCWGCNATVSCNYCLKQKKRGETSNFTRSQICQFKMGLQQEWNLGKELKRDGRHYFQARRKQILLSLLFASYWDMARLNRISLDLASNFVPSQPPLTMPRCPIKMRFTTCT